MQEIGLKNTFLAGIYIWSALIAEIFNSCQPTSDYNTDPDVYNQTTPSDMGMILDDIYQCAQTGGGTFAAVYQGEISQSECQMMITFLTQNEIAGLTSSRHS